MAADCAAKHARARRRGRRRRRAPARRARFSPHVVLVVRAGFGARRRGLARYRRRGELGARRRRARVRARLDCATMPLDGLTPRLDALARNICARPKARRARSAGASCSARYYSAPALPARAARRDLRTGRPPRASRSDRASGGARAGAGCGALALPLRGLHLARPLLDGAASAAPRVLAAATLPERRARTRLARARGRQDGGLGHSRARTCRLCRVEAFFGDVCSGDGPYDATRARPPRGAAARGRASRACADDAFWFDLHDETSPRPRARPRGGAAGGPRSARAPRPPAPGASPAAGPRAPRRRRAAVAAALQLGARGVDRRLQLGARAASIVARALRAARRLPLPAPLGARCRPSRAPTAPTVDVALARAVRALAAAAAARASWRVRRARAPRPRARRRQRGARRRSDDGRPRVSARRRACAPRRGKRAHAPRAAAERRSHGDAAVGRAVATRSSTRGCTTTASRRRLGPRRLRVARACFRVRVRRLGGRRSSRPGARVPGRLQASDDAYRARAARAPCARRVRFFDGPST